MAWCDRIILVLLGAIVSLPIIIKARQSVPENVSAGFFTASSAKGFVRVSGDVRHPGIYTLPANAMTVDVIKMAVPLRPIKTATPSGVERFPVANGTAIRLANPDGQPVITITRIPASERILMGIPLDINVMSETDFQYLPGIGPVTAQRIIAYRHKNGGSMEVRELLNVEGIGEKRYEKLKKLF